MWIRVIDVSVHRGAGAGSCKEKGGCVDWKKLIVPWSNRTKEIDAVQMWEVRWRSRHGDFSHDTRPELECFTSESLAEEFAESLQKAFKLIRHTSGDSVRVYKAKSR